MKSRLSSSIGMLVTANVAAFAAAIWFAYSAGKQTGAGTPDTTGMIIAIVAAVAATIILAWRFGSIITPVNELAAFSERLAAGDAKARADVSADNEFGYIAENLNRAVAKVSKASSNQEASESLQRSITDLLAVINQVARGDLTLRAR